MKKVLALVFLLSSIVIVGAATTGRSRVSIAPSGAQRTAAAIYSKECTSCHGKDGQAKSLKGKHVHARNLTDAQWQDNVSDERLFNSINNGKGKKMPAFGKKLSDSEVDSLVNYVRGLKK